MGKMGRPKKDVVKDKLVAIRLEAAEYDRLVEYSQKHCLTITEIIKKGIDLFYNSFD